MSDRSCPEGWRKYKYEKSRSLMTFQLYDPWNYDAKVRNWPVTGQWPAPLEEFDEKISAQRSLRLYDMSCGWANATTCHRAAKRWCSDNFQTEQGHVDGIIQTWHLKPMKYYNAECEYHGQVLNKKK
jgi:hypothetical protein